MIVVMEQKLHAWVRLTNSVVASATHLKAVAMKGGKSDNKLSSSFIGVPTSG